MADASLRTGVYSEIDPKQFEGRFTGKNVLVTGSGRGIGKEIAIAFAKSGANVAITSRTESQVNHTVNEVNALKQGGKVVGVVADGCKRDDQERLVNQVSIALYTWPSPSR